MNADLGDDGVALATEVARTNLQITEVITIIRRINQNAAIGAEWVLDLGGALGADEPGDRLAVVYQLIGNMAEETLRASNQNAAAYRSGGRSLVTFIERLPALQAELDALLLAPASPSPSASVGSPLPSPPPPSSAPPPSASPSTAPSSAAPSGEVPSGSPSPFVPGGPEPSRAPDEQIENGGFEDRGDVSWSLARAPGANAALTLDPEQPATGSLSARVDITTGSDAFSGIALRQTGLQLEIGRNYTVSFNVRSTAARKIRVKVMPAFGGSYQTRDFDVTNVWTPVSFTFFATDFDPAAVLEIQLGRSTATTWIDTVSFRPTPPF